VQRAQIAVARSARADLVAHPGKDQVDRLQGPFHQLGQRQALPQQRGLRLAQGALMQMRQDGRVRADDDGDDEPGADDEAGEPPRTARRQFRLPLGVGRPHPNFPPSIGNKPRTDISPRGDNGPGNQVCVEFL
jgi:hypothetical protein